MKMVATSIMDQRSTCFTSLPDATVVFSFTSSSYACVMRHHSNLILLIQTHFTIHFFHDVNCGRKKMTCKSLSHPYLTVNSSKCLDHFSLFIPLYWTTYCNNSLQDKTWQKMACTTKDPLGHQKEDTFGSRKARGANSNISDLCSHKFLSTQKLLPDTI